MLTIHPDKILVYQDHPQLWLGSDQVGCRYVCMYIETDSEFIEYIALPVSSEKLNALLLGKIDLREAFITSETGIWFNIAANDSEEFSIQPFEFSSIDKNFLPKSGFYFPVVEYEKEGIISEVIEKKNTIVHLSFVDEHNRQSIEIDTLSDFMRIFQNFVKYIYKKAISTSGKLKGQLDRPNNYVLSAFATSPGSFNIHLEARADSDLFGNTQIEKALNIIDKITNEISTDLKIIENIKPYKGHALNSYRNLLAKIIRNNLKFTYKWSSPATMKVHTNSFNKVTAEKIYAILNEKADLGQEIKELVGFVKEADVEKGNWRIQNIEDNKPYSGTSIDINLDGITLNTVKYKFVCEETVEELKVSEAEKINYKLLSFEAAQ